MKLRKHMEDAPHMCVVQEVIPGSTRTMSIGSMAHTDRYVIYEFDTYEEAQAHYEFVRDGMHGH